MPSAAAGAAAGYQATYADPMMGGGMMAAAAYNQPLQYQHHLHQYQQHYQPHQQQPAYYDSQLGFKVYGVGGMAAAGLGPAPPPHFNPNITPSMWGQGGHPGFQLGLMSSEGQLGLVNEPTSYIQHGGVPGFDTVSRDRISALAKEVVTSANSNPFQSAPHFTMHVKDDSIRVASPTEAEEDKMGASSQPAAANAASVGPDTEKTGLSTDPAAKEVAAGAAAEVRPNAGRLVSPAGPAREREAAEDEPAPKRRRSDRVVSHDE